MIFRWASLIKALGSEDKFVKKIGKSGYILVIYSIFIFSLPFIFFGIIGKDYPLLLLSTISAIVSGLFIRSLRKVKNKKK